MADQDEEKILADARKLSFSERVAHKSWKARSEAYDSIASACERALSEADDCFAEYGPLLSKAAADANVAALDKALAAVVAYLSRCSEAHAARVAGPVCSAICKQGLKQRPGTVKRCTYVCLALIELEQGDVVVELVIKALSDKTPKVVVAALDILTQAFSEFGPKVLQPQPIFKALPILFEAKQVPVRDGVKKLTVEAASWLGPDIVRSLLLDKMPDMMRKDIEKLVEEAGAGIRKQPERFTRKEMSRRAAATAPAASLMAPTATLAQPSSADTAMAGDDMGMDAYDFADPVDVLGRLDKAFWEGLSSAKWSERRDALQNLKQLASSPKLAPGDYADVVRELRKVIVKDSNVVCVAEAAACLGNLAKGLRKDFSNTARAMFANLLDKLKDKNTAVCVQSAQALVDFHRYCVGLADVSDDFTGAVGHKNPKLRSEAIKLLQTCVEASTRDAIMKAQAHILPAIAIAANDAAPAIRDASAQLLVAFALKSGSMKSIEKYIDKLDDSRKKKLEDMLDAARKGRAPAAQAAPPPSHRNQASMSQNNGGPSMAKPLSPKDTNSLKSAKIPAAKKSSRPAMQSQPSEKNIADDDDAGLQSGALSQAEVEEKFTVIVGEEIVKRLRSSNWKERLGAMEDLQSRTQEMNGSMDASMLIQGMSHLPGWSEKNFQVMAKAFDLITQIAGADVTISKKDAFVALGGMVPKLSDGKLKGPVSDALTALAEVVGPQFICAQLHKQASAQKNPKVLNEALVWMAKAIEEFGLSSLDVKLLIDWMIADLGSSNVGVRNAATTLLGTAHKQLGPGLVPMLSQHVKPALMTSLNDAFKANPLTKVVPVRQVRGRSLSTARGPSSKASSAPCRADDIKDLAAPDDLLPRTDISASISPSLTDRFVSPKWQERNAALEEVENVLKAAGGRIQPSVNNLVALLKGRLADTNANLVARTLVLAGEVAKAMGAAWDRSAREFLKAALEGLADKKKQVRDGVVTLLEAWVQVVPADRVIAPLADYLNSPKAAGAEGKGAVLRWAATLVKDGRAGCCVEAAIYAASSGVLDKSADARETGSALMLTLLQVHGRAKVTQAANGLSGAAKKAASEALLKVSSSKEGMAVPDVAAVNSYAIAVSCESSLNENDSRPPSRSGPSSSSVASSRSHKNVLQPGVKEPPAAKKGCLAASTRKDERARKHRGRFGKFDPPREEEEESLEAELSPLASETLRSLLFAKNFQKHVEAADVIMAELSASGEGEAVLSCLDLLLRWAVIRLCDPRGNTTSLLKVLDMCKALLEFLDARDEQLSQIEAACFFPCIVEKAGHNNDRIRAQHRELLHVAQRVYPVPRLIEFLSHGLSSKNWRTRVECTEVLSEILALEGLSVFERSKEKPFPVIAQMVSERDSGVRAAALNMIEKLYLLTGSAATWTLLGQLSPQQHSLIEERLKYKDKQDTPMAQASSSVISGVDTYLSSSRVSPGASRLQQQFTPGAAPLRSPPTSTRVSSPQEAAATPRQGTHLTRCHLPTPVPKATPMPRASVQQAPAMVDMLTPLAPSMVARRQETGAEAQLARWETGMDLLQRNKEDDYVEGMKLLSYELMDVMKEMEGSSMPEERVLCHYESCASQLVMELVYKVHMVFEVAEQNNEHARSVRLCTYTLNTLMQVFALRRLALAVPLAPLRELIKELLLRLLDPGTRKLPNATQILKGLNVLMLRVVENSDQTLAICVLIELLDFKWKDSTPEQHAAFADLVVKCLLKPTKALDVNIRDLRVIQVLQALHHFFESLGSNEIRRRGVEEDKPLRMAKTLLHELCKHKGPHILDYMPDIPVDCQPDELLIIYQYVEINLKTLEAAQGFRSRSMQSSQVDSRSSSDQQTAASLREAPSTGMPIASARQPLCTGQHLSIPSDPLSAQASSADACSPVLSSMPRASALVPFRAASSTSARDADIQNQPSNVPDAAAHVSGVAPKAIGSTARSALADIFKKIGEKKTSEQGLMELHLFGLKNPDVDFDAHLAKTSANFKAYIESGLKKAARIYSGADKSQLPAAGDNAGHMLPGDGDPSTPRTSSVEQLRARMQRLKCSPASL